MQWNTKVIPINKDSLQLDNFKAVFKRYYAALCFFAGRLVDDTVAAEDIVEEVFIKLWQKEPDFSQHTNTKALLYISVKNACMDYIKKRNRDKDRMNGFVQMVQDEVVDNSSLFEMVRAEVLRELYAAMQELPIERRTVMHLIYVEGWDSKKVAEHLAISIHTVKKHRLRGIKDLRAAGVSFALLSALATIAF